MFNRLSTERPRKILGEQPGLPYCVQNNVTFYLGYDHNSQPRVQTKKRRGVRGESYVHPRYLHLIYANDILFGNMLWMRLFRNKLYSFEQVVISSLCPYFCRGEYNSHPSMFIARLFQFYSSL